MRPLRPPLTARQDLLNPANFGATGSGSVYYICTAEACKIGFTTSPAKRMRSFKMLIPVPVTLRAIEPGDRGLERARHENFAWLRMPRYNEWFRLDDVLERHIEGLRSSLPSRVIESIDAVNNWQTDADGTRILGETLDCLQVSLIVQVKRTAVPDFCEILGIEPNAIHRDMVPAFMWIRDLTLSQVDAATIKQMARLKYPRLREAFNASYV